MASKCCSVDELLSFALFYPLPHSLRPNSTSEFHVWIPRPRPGIAFFPHVNSADFQSGGVGGGLISHLAGFSPNIEIRFLIISPYLHDFCPVFLLIFSPLETDFLMLFKPSGYSLLCSKKQLPRHNTVRANYGKWVQEHFNLHVRHSISLLKG